VEHGCALAVFSGSRSVLVVGGATGDDVNYQLINVWCNLRWSTVAQ
jgi:hypothetical protein